MEEDFLSFTCLSYTSCHGGLQAAEILLRLSFRQTSPVNMVIYPVPSYAFDIAYFLCYMVKFYYSSILLTMLASTHQPLNSTGHATSTLDMSVVIWFFFL